MVPIDPRSDFFANGLPFHAHQKKKKKKLYKSISPAKVFQKNTTIFCLHPKSKVCSKKVAWKWNYGFKYDDIV